MITFELEDVRRAIFAALVTILHRTKLTLLCSSYGVAFSFHVSGLVSFL